MMMTMMVIDDDDDDNDDDDDDCHPVEAKWETDEEMRAQDCGNNENEIFTNFILLMKQIDLKR